MLDQDWENYCERVNRFGRAAVIPDPYDKAQLGAWWERQSFKIYIVKLFDNRRTPKKRPDIKFIRVNTFEDNKEIRKRAGLKAVDESVDYRPASWVGCNVRLAHPVIDMGCEWNGFGVCPV